jgi:hypothetical protein
MRIRLEISVLSESWLLAFALGCHFGEITAQITIPAGGNPTRTIPE